MNYEFSDFAEFSAEISVIMPNPLNVPNITGLFRLPQKRKNREDPCGYPVSQFEFPPPSDFLCAICQNVVRKPLECKKCSKLYCMSCINMPNKVTNSLGVISFSCSLCMCKQEPTQPSLILTRIISELKIKCMNYDGGCKTFISIEESNRHNLICPYRSVQCENYRNCRRFGLIKEFIESDGPLRNLYSHLSSRTHGLHRTYLCSEKCKKVLAFEKLVSEKQTHKAISEYYNLLKKKAPLIIYSLL